MKVFYKNVFLNYQLIFKDLPRRLESLGPVLLAAVQELNMDSDPLPQMVEGHLHNPPQELSHLDLSIEIEALLKDGRSNQMELT